MDIETNMPAGMNYANSSPKKYYRMDTGQEQTSISSEHASSTLH